MYLHINIHQRYEPDQPERQSCFFHSIPDLLMFTSIDSEFLHLVTFRHTCLNALQVMQWKDVSMTCDRNSVEFGPRCDHTLTVGVVLMWTQAAASPERQEVKMGSVHPFSIAPFAVDGAYQMVAGFSHRDDLDSRVLAGIDMLLASP